MTRIARTLTATAVAAGLTVAGLVAPSAASAAATSLTASPDASVYNYGARTTIRGHLSAKTFYGKLLPVQIASVGADTIHGSTRVDSAGNFKLAPQIYTNTAVALYFPGSSGYAKASRVLHVSVRVKIVTAFEGSYKSAGGYKYVRPGTKPGFGVGVLPSKAGRNASFRLQVYRDGWRTIQTKSFKLDDRSAAGVSITGSTGYSYRVRGEYGSDSANVSNVSAFTYVRFA